MFGSDVLDVLIGLFTLYLILSVMVSAFNEVIRGLLNSRGARLAEFINKTLGDYATPFSEYIAYQPSVDQRFKQMQKLMKHWSLPSQIKNEQFTRAFMDIVMRLQDQPLSERLAQAPDKIDAITRPILQSIDKLQDPQLKNRLARLVMSSAASFKLTTEDAQTAVIQAEKFVQDLHQEIERQVTSWYDTQMSRLSELYKRNIQFVIFCLGLTIALVMNIDTIEIANQLLINPTLRDSIVAQSQALAADGSILNNNDLNVINSQLSQLGLELGWGEGDFPTLQKLIGILITAFAVSQGAPFWFDVLNKVTNLRWGAKPPAETSENKGGSPAAAPAVPVTAAPPILPPSASPPTA